MCNRLFFKRLIPFFITLTVGLIIAGFFVDINPNFRFRKNRFGRRHEMIQLKGENIRLKSENDLLRQQIEMKRVEAEFRRIEDLMRNDELVPPPPPLIAPRKNN
jgi:hypothetical protein